MVIFNSYFDITRGQVVWISHRAPDYSWLQQCPADRWIIFIGLGMVSKLSDGVSLIQFDKKNPVNSWGTQSNL